MSKKDKNIDKSDPSNEIFNRSYGAMKSIVLNQFDEYSDMLNTTYQKR